MISLLDRLVDKIDCTGSCWTFTGALDPTGYGRIGVGPHSVAFAHRVAYELSVGPIPDGLVIDHLCRNPPCVNPDHLEVVTPEENMRRSRNVDQCWRGHAKADHEMPRSDGKSSDCRACKRIRAEARRAGQPLKRSTKELK